MRAVAHITRGALRCQAGFVSFAVVIFFMAILAVSFAVSMRTSAMAVGLRSFDAVRFQTLEKNGLAQVVEQSISAIRGTATTQSTKSIDQEIRTRLSALTITPDVSITLGSFQVPAAHAFYPFAAAPGTTSATEYSSGTDGIAGKGLRLYPFLESQVYSYLGRSSFTFDRTASGYPNENRTYTVNADCFSVPLTNIPVVAYGLPASLGVVPGQAPVLPILNPTNISRLTITSNNPTNDPTAFSDLYGGQSPEQWPAQFGPAAIWCWDAYEYIWSTAYQNGLMSAGGPTSTFDFSSPSNATIPGVSTISGAMTIDLSALISNPLIVVDGIGNQQINIVGSPAAGQPCLLFFKNSATSPTHVQFAGDNQRPVLLIAKNCALNFSGNPSINAAMILDPLSTASGTVTIFGHLSFYAGSNLFPSWNLTLNGSHGYEASYASIAPRVFLVSARGAR